MNTTATDAMRAAPDFRSDLRKLAETNWVVHKLLALLDSGRVPADQWADFAILTLAKYNEVLMADIIKHNMTHCDPQIIFPPEKT